MSFVLAKAAVAVFISPLGASAVLGIAALAGAGLRRPRLAAGLGGVALAWLLLWSTPEASHALRRALESPYPPVPVAELPTAQTIVVLGGGIAPPGPAPMRWTAALGDHD